MELIRRLIVVGIMTLTVGFSSESRAESPSSDAAAPLTVAVLGFTAPDSDGNHVGQMINDTVEVLLSGEGGFSLVNRSELAQTIEEMGLNLSAVTDADKAVSVGKVVGAKLLVTGKAFELGESRVITVKVIGSETTLVKAAMSKGTLDEPLDKLVLEAAEKLAALLRAHGAELVAGEPPADPIPGLVAQLQEKELPVFAVVIPEEHRATRAAARDAAVPDPAVETEIKLLLIEAGADVRDIKNNALADWVTAFEAGDSPAWPRSLEGVDLVVIGEAFSEDAGTLGELQLASARAEVNIVSRETGRIVFADRATTRGVDLAREIAGKSALEKAGRVIGRRVLEKLAEGERLQ